MSEAVFERRGLRRLLGIAIPSFLIALVVAVLGDGLRPVRGFGHNGFSKSAVGHRALIEVLERLDIPVVRSRSRSGVRASRGGVLLLIDPLPDDDPGNVDMERMRTMIESASTTLLTLPKWNVRQSTLDEGWAQRRGRAQWAAERMLADLDLSETRVRDLTSSSRESWETQNFGPAPVLPETQLVTSRDLDPLIDHENGILAGETMLFDRRVVLLSDPDLLTTRGLSEPGNAVLVVRLIEHLRRGGPVVIDEVLHGYAVSPSIWRTMFRPPVLYLILHAALCLALLIWAGWRRFGPAPPPRIVQPQGLRERIDQAAQLLGSGPTTQVALAGYLQGARRVVQARFSVVGGATAATDETLDRLSRARDTSETWTTLAQAVRTGRAKPNTQSAVHLAQRVHRWRQEMMQ